MKKLKTMMLLAVIACTLSASAQDFSAKYSTFGGKSQQKEMKKIYIADFVIKQILRRNATAKAGGGLTADPVYAHMTVDFGGVEPAAYQQTVDELYKMTVDKFKALGYEVITGDDAKAKTGKELKPGGVGEPENQDRVGYHVAIRPKDQLLFQTKSIFAANSYNTIAKDLDAIVFTFAFQVEYVSYNSSGSSMFGTKASLEAKPYLAVSANTLSSVPKGASSLVLQPHKTADDWVGPGGFTKTSQSNVGGSFLSSGDISKSSKYVVDINQAKYLAYLKEMVTKELDYTIDSWVEQLTK